MSKKNQHPAPAKPTLGHTKLEPRRLLNADFSLVAGSLTLDDFVDSTASADEVTISQSGLVYSFVLTDGVWTGDDSAAGVDLLVGDTTLAIDTALASLTSILMDSNLADAFDIDFGDFDFTGDFDITSTGGTLFDDITQQGLTSFVHVGTLDIDGATNITLGEANNFDIVNIENATAVTLNDSAGIQFTALEATADATVTAAGDVELAAVVVVGNLDVSTTAGDITQVSSIDVTGTSALSASALVCLDDPTNDFVGEVTASGSTVEIVDANDLVVGDIDAVDDIFLRSGATASGSLTLNGNLTTSAVDGQVLLQSDSGVTQAAAAIITTNDLLLGGDLADEGSGNFDLTESNVVGFLAADLENDLSFVNAASLEIADLTYTSACGTAEMITGLNIGGNLVLNVTGELSQSALVVVTVTSGLTASDTICLTDPTNDFAGEVTATGTTVEIVDSNDLVVGAVIAADDIFLRSGATASGSLTINGDLTTSDIAGQVLLQSDSGATQVAGSSITTSELLVGGNDADEGTGDFDLIGSNLVGALATDIMGELHFVTTAAPFVFASNMLTYSSVCTTTETITGINATDKIRISADGITISDTITSITVFLESTAGVTQSAAILTTNLMLSGTGVFDLTDPGNDATNLAAAITGTLNYVDANGINIAELTCDLVTLTGVDVSLDLTIDTSLGNGDITQDPGAPVVVGVATTLIAGTGDICLTDPTNDFMGEVAATGSTVELVDRNDLTTGVISAVDDIFLRSGATDTGALTLNGDLTTSDIAGQVLLQSDSGATQDAGSSITTSELLVGGNDADEGTGDFDLIGSNLVGALATDIMGELHFVTTAAPFVFASNMLTYSSVCTTTETITGINATDKIRISADGITISDTITSITVFLESTAGVTQSAAILTTNLMLSGTGVFDLTDPGNDATNLAAAITGTLNYVDANGINIAELTCDLVTLTGVDVSLDLTIDTSLGNGDITQDPGAPVIVGATTTLIAGTGDICLTDPTNDFVGEVTATGSTVELVDRNDLTTGVISAEDDIFLRSGATDTGALTLNGNLTTSDIAGQILLQSDSGAMQGAGSVITTSELLVGGNDADEGTGAFNLIGSNVVGAIATDIVGELYFVTTAAPFVFASSMLTYSSDCLTTETITGINATDKIRISADGITISDTITSTTVFLESTNGVTQGAGGEILATNLMLSGTGLFDLTNPANDTDNLAADITGTLNYFDANDLTIANLTCDAVVICGLTISGDLNLTTNNGDLFQAPDPAMPTVNSAAVIVGGNTVLDTGTGDICLTGGDCDGNGINENIFAGTLTIVSSGDVVIAENDNISIDSVVGGGSYRFIGNFIDINTAITGTQLLLEASLGVDYNGFMIDVTDLMLSGSGVFDFGTSGETVNSIDNLAADIDGSLNLINGNDLDIGDLLFSSDCGDVAICGVNIDAGGGTGNLELIVVDADLTQSASIAVEGTTLLDAGTGDICLTGGDCTSDGLNDNDFVGEVTATGATVEVVDANSLVVGDVVAVNNIFLRSGDNGSGGLTLNGNLTTSGAAGQILLQSDSGATQGGASVITTSELLVGGDAAGEGTGVFDLVGSNVVGTIAADITGELHFINTPAIVVGSLSYNSACGTTEAIVGVSATDKVRISADGITINEPITSTTVFLESTSGVIQGASGSILTTNLMLSGIGLFDLTNTGNDTDNLAADIDGTLNYFDADDLTIATLTCDAIEICGLTITGDLNLTTNNGDLFQAPDPAMPTVNSAAVIVGGNTVLDAGTGNICLTGGDCTGDGLNDNDFVGEVTAIATVVEIVDSNALVVGDIVALDDIFLRSGDNGVGILTLNGNLTTIAADGQILLQSDSGVTQAAVTAITTSELILGGDLADEGSGNFVLTASNVVGSIAADLENNLEFANTTSLVIADLAYASDCGTSETICGLNIGGDLNLNVTGSLTQTASVIVVGTTDLAATVNICLTGGDCTGDGLNDNDFVGEVSAMAVVVEIVDSNALVAGDITAVDDIFLRSGDNGVGSITLNGSLTTSAADGQILLQSDTGVTQAVASVTTTSELLLGGDLADDGSGDFVLTGANLVDSIAADLQDDLSFVNATSLNVADLTYLSNCDTNEAICGLDIGGDLSLDITGDLSQTAAVIVQGTSNLIASGTICFTGGDCTGDGLNDNDFVGQVTANASSVEIVDSNELLVGDITAASAIFLRSGFSGNVLILNEGSLTLNGNLLTTNLDGQVLLQSDDGVTQSSGVITTSELLLGGNVADEGTGGVNLTGANRIANLGASLLQGTLQLNNVVDLTIASSLNFVSCTPFFNETVSGLFVGIGDATLLFADPNIALAGTTQGTIGNVGDRFNPEFGQFLNITDIGIAILNSGSLTTELGAVVTAIEGDIYLETTGSGSAITVNDTVRVIEATPNPMMDPIENRILAVAGGNLNMTNGEFVRFRTGMIVGQVNTELNELVLENPGSVSQTNVQVDVNTFTQDLQFSYGADGELQYTSTIFWGIGGLEDNTFDSASLTAADLAALETLLFNGGTNFESRSYYDLDPQGPFNVGADGFRNTVTSQPIGSTFDTGGNANDTGVATASFRLDFLRNNSEFRNVQFLFNDANINIFENSDTDVNMNGMDDDLTDLNVATADFEGRARIGIPPVVEVERTEFQTPQRVEITVAPETEFFETIVVDEDPLYVQTVQPKFFVVVYFESQFEADQFEAEFESLDDDETGEKDFDTVKQQILEKSGLEFLEWESDDDSTAVDANQIREILERAILDLNEEDDGNWIDEYKSWLRKQSNDNSDVPDVPRGVFKIIEVENGKATIQGDDVDRRFVPEPDDNRGFEDFKFKDDSDSDSGLESNDGGTSQYLPGEQNRSTRFARWSAMLNGESTAIVADQPVEMEITNRVEPDQFVADSRYLVAGSTGLGMLAMLCRHNTKNNKTVNDEIESLGELKAEDPSRNIFSRSARFKRRNEFVVRKNDE